MSTTILVGDVREKLRTMPDNSAHCVVTSPPYYGLRDYGVAGQIGSEPTLAAFLGTLVEVFREVRRVLHPSGTCWINCGDSYYGGGQRGSNLGSKAPAPKWADKANREQGHKRGTPHPDHGLKFKDLMMVPARLAIALCDDGWYLRSDIIWHKKAPMPESVTDRPTSAHEHIFLLAKQPRYFYDGDAIREPYNPDTLSRYGSPMQEVRPQNHQPGKSVDRPNEVMAPNPAGRNLRNVWTLGPEPFPRAHFATYPTAIPERCIKAGSSEKGCCPTCRAPWTRVVERGPLPPEPTHRNPTKRLEPGQAGNADAGNMGFRASRLSGQEMNEWKSAHPDKTTGWQPGCECDAGPPVPCLVLDPFLGSGTTAMVAARLGRDAIGIELNPEYARMAEARIRDDCPMFNVVEAAS